ncbi:TPA: hypothetical protein QDA96_006020 [Burkholderia vietnamiensis]|uniref:hypothetical protein n=1 Tax=Burkholderia TaxID=32008 RepID=UPI0007573A92|nr:MULTISPECIES: hypothetical protein [Burkholderia]KVF07700.1 hypothetical protein WJ05_21580 [Burkholderia vietnamiensis]KVF31585.1 hypothetical protein WJ09_18650 [Burkholderia vietnamiensis]KVR80599.1 hypothetical protein WK27_25575 [Burkholderia vietnamiensis]KVS24568.1 hypothetical protein WK34_16660 [Burkholderia vietnamiensis]MBR8015698.1 hypothetical protein [Burkholderia vietnamiensis]
MSASTVKPHCSSVTRWLTLTALGYAVLVAVSLWLPLGLHRIIMRRKDWWKWPVSYAALVAGALVWIATDRHSFGVVVLLASGAAWFYMLATDLVTMWTWQWPFQSTPSEYLDALDRRLNIKANASLFVIVAVAMLFLARVA